MSKNMVEPERLQKVIWRRVACWISKATRAQAHSSAPLRPHTHKQARLIAFPRQQELRQRASTLRYTYIAVLVEKMSTVTSSV
jgi:hypothetical protein